MELKDIHSPADIKGLSLDSLEQLCDSLRATLIRKLAAHGGHVGPNLGVVEATVALHYVFNAPEDKIVFDVSHQSYVHKMLTGRIEAFIDPSKYNDVSGYTSPAESDFDLFEVGHTSTSIPLATGLAKARDMAGGKENVVAFIGDASLGGGMALEGLNYAPTLGSNFIVVLNDNQMSIAENHGALYDHLKALRDTNGTASDNIFKALGYEYVYVREGNDLRSLVKAFAMVKDSPRAVLVHLNTMKGMGLPAAESHKEKFHFSAPFDMHTGALSSPDYSEDYGEIFTRRMLELIESDPRVAVLTAGTPGAVGFSEEHRKLAGGKFIDVGIAEQDAVAMAAGMAKGGARPVMGVVATFLQRAYDQLLHDVAINSLPAVFVEFYGGVYAMNDVTHLGLFDIAMVSNIPGILMLSASDKEEYLAMIDWAVKQTEQPVVIRTPGGSVKSSGRPVLTPFTRYAVVKDSDKADVAIIAEGAFVKTALEAAALLAEKGVECKVLNARMLSQVDSETLDSMRGLRKIITLEDGIIDGGFGQKVAAYLGDAPVRVKTLGLRKEFVDRFKVSELLQANGLTPAQIAAEAMG